MARTKKTEVTNDVKNTKATAAGRSEEVKVDEFTMKNKVDLMSLHDMLAYAHDTIKNSRALSKKDFEDKGVSEQVFNQWEAYVEELRLQVVEYNKLAQSSSASSKAINNALGHVWVAWRLVIKQGTESEYNKNFFIRENDAHMIAEWAGLTAVTTAHGKQWSTASKTNFRRNVETAIGIRMAGNNVLSDDDRDLIQAYESAQKTVTNMTNALNDKIESGKTTPGYRTLLRGAEKALEDMQKLVKTLDVTDESRQKILEKYEFAVTAAKASVTDAEKKIKAAQETIDEKQKNYDKLIATLKSVGDDK
ncbi:MAG: hypothetical protein K6F00_11245 [Lachnospiraceae bacterium]|nr:hypothetical protein [Lachnospiraceae bacterium]